LGTKPSAAELQETLFRKLRQSANYRDFLQTYLTLRNLTLSDFARATGFGRGFPGDIISGKRRLTAKSYYPFEKALKLPLLGKKLFRLLVAVAEPDIFPELDRVHLDAHLQDLRKKPWDRSRRQVQEIESPGFHQLLKEYEVMKVYAAAGNPDTGASREQILRRTRLPAAELDKNLQKLEDIGLLHREDRQYFPKDLHLFLQTSDRSQILTTLFQRATEVAHRRVSQAADSKSEFFFTSQFCVSEIHMPALKAALRETILKFVDDSIDPEGDRVIRLLLSMHF
jgi:transcriptional regulator with XRE-family HTH domain